MADGTQKPIELIEAGDMVMSFDPHAENGLGANIPGKVTRTFRNTTRVLIDLWGLHVTPGHEFLTDGGAFMKIADILRRDRAIVRNENNKGVLYRARTNCSVGSDEDIIFPTFFTDPQTGKIRYAHVRGCKMFGMRPVPDAPMPMREPVALIEILRESGARWTQQGEVIVAEGPPIKAIQWPEGRTPFDTGDDTGAIVTLDNEAYTPDWIANIPRDGEEVRATMNAGGGPNDLLLISPFGRFTMKTEDGKHTFNAPAPRGTLPPVRPSLVSSNLTMIRPSYNRAVRRKQAALSRVK